MKTRTVQHCWFYFFDPTNINTRYYCSRNLIVLCFSNSHYLLNLITYPKTDVAHCKFGFLLWFPLVGLQLDKFSRSVRFLMFFFYFFFCLFHDYEMNISYSDTRLLFWNTSECEIQYFCVYKFSFCPYRPRRNLLVRVRGSTSSINRFKLYISHSFYY